MRAVTVLARFAIGQARQMRGLLSRIGRNQQHLPETFCAIGMPHQLGNPHGVAGLVLAGEDAHAGRRFLDRPLEGAEFRCREAAVRHGHGPLEIVRSEWHVTACADFLGARGRV